MSVICDLWLVLMGCLTLVAATPPLFLWTSHDLHIKAPHLGQTLLPDDFQNRVSKNIFGALKGTNVALFVQPGLTFPDLLSYGGGDDDDVLPNLRRFVTPEYHAVAFDRVHDPLSAFRGRVDGVRVVRVRRPDQIDDDLERSDPHFVNVFEIFLPDVSPDDPAATLRSNDAVMGEVMRKLQGINHPFVGVFTGEDSDEELPSVHQIKKRAAEAKDDVKGPEFNVNHLWTSDCIQAYFSKIKVFLYEGEDEKSATEMGNTKPTVTSVCNKDKPSSITAVYKLEDKKITVTIKLTFDTFGKPVRGWKLSAARVKLVNETTPHQNDLLTNADAWASKGFSFHCSVPETFKPNETTGSHVRLEVKELQVEGLMKAGETKFGPAFDCVGFFSMPIFIGLLTSLLLIVFTIFAAVAMATIRTPEKFDDPKGEKISVPNE